MAVDELENTLAETDPDRYVANFFAPAAARPGLAAIYAFENEVARIGLAVREPMMGHIRLAWWREQIGAIYAGEPVQALVPKALAAAIPRWQLPRALFDAVIDARAKDLEEAPFPDEEAFEAWTAQTSGWVLQLAARVLGAEHRADLAIQHAATAIAYRNALRDFQAARAFRRFRLPVSWLESVGLNVEDALAEGARLPVLVQRGQKRTRQCLINTNHTRFPLKAMPVLSVAALARVAVDPFRPESLTPWQRASRLALANLTWRV